MDIVKQAALKMDKRIGVIGLIIKPSMLNKTAIRDVLNAYLSLIIGKMEIFRAIEGAIIMSVVIEATTDEVGALTGKLGTLPGVRIKTSLV